MGNAIREVPLRHSYHSFLDVDTVELVYGTLNLVTNLPLDGLRDRQSHWYVHMMAKHSSARDKMAQSFCGIGMKCLRDWNSKRINRKSYRSDSNLYTCLCQVLSFKAVMECVLFVLCFAIIVVYLSASHTRYVSQPNTT